MRPCLERGEGRGKAEDNFGKCEAMAASSDGAGCSHGTGDGSHIPGGQAAETEEATQ